ncbi:MAG: hypothetical protein M3Z04_18400 [Chloroflexota bacterium]|nr:hypothetical protein [Chloroflexota bacterium]
MRLYALRGAVLGLVLAALVGCNLQPDATPTPVAPSAPVAAPTVTGAAVAPATDTPRLTSDTPVPAVASATPPVAVAGDTPVALASDTPMVAAVSDTPTVALAAGDDLPPAPTAPPQPTWPTDAPPTPFAPPQPFAEAAALTLPPAPALAAFAAALRPAFAGDVTGQEGRSVYQIALRLDPAGGYLWGRERVAFTNHGSDPLRRVVLRLYPNFPGIFDERKTPTGFGRLQVGAAQVGGAPAAVGYLAGNTAVAIPLAQALAPGARQTVDLDFRLSLNGLGPAPDMWYFKSFYPLLPVQAGDDWRLDITAFPDQVFAESSFYAVDFQLPAGLTLASGGTETGTEPAGDGLLHHILAGPVREFAATVGARYTQQTRLLGDIQVRATSLLTDTTQAGEDLGYAVKALDVYNRLFGPYPFNELDLVLTPSGGGGIEFPGYVMISHLTPNVHVREHVVSHEVAHQWWFSLVGDDIFRESWLDESFADYSTYLYLQQTDGPAVADQVFDQQTAKQWPGYSGQVATADPSQGKRVGSAIWEFADFAEYDGIIYGKGPVFLDRLRRLLGDDRFLALLQQHFAANKYGITTGRGFLAEAEAVAGADAPAVRDLYRAWVDGR